MYGHSRWELDLLGEARSAFTWEDLRVVVLGKGPDLATVPSKTELCKQLLIKDEGPEPGPAYTHIAPGPCRSWSRFTAVETSRKLVLSNYTRYLISPEPMAEEMKPLLTWLICLQVSACLWLFCHTLVASRV